MTDRDPDLTAELAALGEQFAAQSRATKDALDVVQAELDAQGKPAGLTGTEWLDVQVHQEAITNVCRGAAARQLAGMRPEIVSRLDQYTAALDDAQTALQAVQAPYDAVGRELAEVRARIAEIGRHGDDVPLSARVAARAEKAALLEEETELDRRLGQASQPVNIALANRNTAAMDVRRVSYELDSLDASITNPLTSGDGLETAAGAFWFHASGLVIKCLYDPASTLYGQAARRYLSMVLRGTGIGERIQLDAVNAGRRDPVTVDGGMGFGHALPADLANAPGVDMQYSAQSSAAERADMRHRLGGWQQSPGVVQYSVPDISGTPETWQQ